jgi:hypothetical protein
MADVQTYAGYTLVEEAWDPETHFNRVAAGTVVVHVMQRTVHSKTWEATLAESQSFPGPVNPGNLTAQDGWHLQSCRCTRTLSQPLSKRVVETWANEGQWEEIATWTE